MNMTFERAIEAARASIIQVADPHDRGALSADLYRFREKCPYIGFEDDESNKPYHFRTEWAHVITRVDDSKSATDPGRSVGRIVERTSETIHIPPVRLEARANLTPRGGLAITDFPSGEDVPLIMESQATGLEELFKKHLFVALLGVAEHAGEVRRVTPEQAAHAAIEVASQFDGQTTILCAYLDRNLFPFDRCPEDHVGRYDFGTGLVVGERSLGRGVMLVVKNEPTEVGFVQFKSEIDTVICLKGYAELMAVTTGLFGFCVWGDAPIVKIDFRPPDSQKKA